MRQTADLPDLEVRAPGGGQVILAGAPGRLRGQLHLTNAGSQPSRLQRFAVRTNDLPAQPGPGQLGVRLAPDAGAEVTASLELAPDTPPGEYHATLDVAGHQVEAVLHISPEPAVELTPSRAFLDAAATGLRLVLRNTGNVRVGVAPTARARLTRDPDLTALRFDRTARDHDDDPAGPDAVLRIPGPLDLEPGATAVVDAEVEIDGDLDEERRYLALLPVATATLRVVVNPRVVAPEPKPTTRATPRRARKTAPPRRNDA
jgi:hypothetical protein